MKSRSIISLESQAIDTQQLKSAALSKNSREGVIRILTSLNDYVRSEIDEKQNNQIMSRAKRKVYLARQAQLREHFRREIEKIEFGAADADMRVFTYRSSINAAANISVQLHQNIEARLTLQKDKLLQRLVGFTKGLVDNMY